MRSLWISCELTQTPSLREGASQIVTEAAKKKVFGKWFQAFGTRWKPMCKHLCLKDIRDGKVSCLAGWSVYHFVTAWNVSKTIISTVIIVCTDVPKGCLFMTSVASFLAPCVTKQSAFCLFSHYHGVFRMGWLTPFVSCRHDLLWDTNPSPGISYFLNHNN